MARQPTCPIRKTVGCVGSGLHAPDAAKQWVSSLGPGKPHPDDVLRPLLESSRLNDQHAENLGARNSGCIQ